MNQIQILYESTLTSLPLTHRGKVRDIYEIDNKHLLIVATDRLSAFDVVLPTGIPGKGKILTAISNFWFDWCQNIVPNHLALAEKNLQQISLDAREYSQIQDRSIVSRKLKMLPIEAVVRGYLFGSCWNSYQATGKTHDVVLPANLKMSERLPQPIYTPTTKAKQGEHDESISFNQTVELLGEDLAEEIRTVSIELYNTAARHARKRGIIIADTKFEFGLDEGNSLVLADELLTPDSSRFWPAADYQPGNYPASYDKQFVRDYLETLALGQKISWSNLACYSSKRNSNDLRAGTGTSQGLDKTKGCDVLGKPNSIMLH